MPVKGNMISHFPWVPLALEGCSCIPHASVNGCTAISSVMCCAGIFKVVYLNLITYLRTYRDTKLNDAFTIAGTSVAEKFDVARLKLPLILLFRSVQLSLPAGAVAALLYAVLRGQAAQQGSQDGPWDATEVSRSVPWRAGLCKKGGCLPILVQPSGGCASSPLPAEGLWTLGTEVPPSRPPHSI